MNKSDITISYRNWRFTSQVFNTPLDQSPVKDRGLRAAA